MRKDFLLLIAASQILIQFFSFYCWLLCIFYVWEKYIKSNLFPLFPMLTFSKTVSSSDFATVSLLFVFFFDDTSVYFTVGPYIKMQTCTCWMHRLPIWTFQQRKRSLTSKDPNRESFMSQLWGLVGLQKVQGQDYLRCLLTVGKVSPVTV